MLDQAAWIDVEVASIREMEEILAEFADRRDSLDRLVSRFQPAPADGGSGSTPRNRRKTAGAAVFKAAARLAHPADLARLAEFQLADHGIPVATMGMGPLAPVSRLLCAQCGSVLNYGYLGNTATAPGPVGQRHAENRHRAAGAVSRLTDDFHRRVRQRLEERLP